MALHSDNCKKIVLDRLKKIYEWLSDFVLPPKCDKCGKQF